MSFISEIQSRFKPPLSELSNDIDPLLDMIRSSQDAKFGDYQVNCAMPLQKIVGKPPREIAQDLIDSVDLTDLCSKIEIAGPGFINLTINDSVIKTRLTAAIADERLAVEKVADPKTVVVDFSSPNVAKPMHVGHIRSTVIGDALTRILRFLGHTVISDNHLGDWGTQFGMIIYGHKHFLDETAFQENPIQELARLYRLVRKLMDFHDAKNGLETQRQELLTLQEKLGQLKQQDVPTEKAEAKKHKKELNGLTQKVTNLVDELELTEKKIAAVQGDSELNRLASEHSEVSSTVLEETAKLHAGDQENKQLWDQVLPHCKDDIARIYNRLDVEFDHEHGESFYHDMLPGVVESLESKKMVTVSDGAKCIFLDEFDTPMIIQKKDGAFLYSTSDLATIEYRSNEWKPDLVLYVVDHRQHEHFQKLFTAAQKWGYDDVELVHVQFGTVLGKDKKPMKTRDGDTVGLEGLLDEAVNRAFALVTDADDGKPSGPELSEQERNNISLVVGHGALKYADLSQNRTSDYVFDYDKMVAMKGNTATYLQYCYARVQGIMRKGNYDIESLRDSPVEFQFSKPVERAVGLQLLRFAEALEEVQKDFRPNLLANYLYELTDSFFTFYNDCSVKDAETDELRSSRLQLCDLVARTIKKGLELLGIGVVDQM